MQGVLVVFVLIAVVLSRPIEVRLWRAGRLSDRTVVLLLLGRLPVVCFVAGLITGLPWPLLVALTVLLPIPPALLYRFTLDVIREQAREARRQI